MIQLEGVQPGMLLDMWSSHSACGHEQKALETWVFDSGNSRKRKKKKEKAASLT